SARPRASTRSGSSTRCRCPTRSLSESGAWPAEAGEGAGPRGSSTGRARTDALRGGGTDHSEPDPEGTDRLGGRGGVVDRHRVAAVREHGAPAVPEPAHPALKSARVDGRVLPSGDREHRDGEPVEAVRQIDAGEGAPELGVRAR